jgi:hypothetical protein
MKKVSQSNPKENTDEQRIALCQQRVNSLKNINPQSYQKRIAYFNGLLSNASGYAGIRSNVDESTRKAIDALYKYKTEKFCADVEHELMSDLSSRVESLNHEKVCGRSRCFAAVVGMGRCIGGRDCTGKDDGIPALLKFAEQQQAVPVVESAPAAPQPVTAKPKPAAVTRGGQRPSDCAESGPATASRNHPPIGTATGGSGSTGGASPQGNTQTGPD